MTMEIPEKLKRMLMEPQDWAGLALRVAPAEYRRLVLDYQKRGEGRLPRCGSVFKVCRRCTPESRCASRGFCKLKREN